MDTEPTPTQTVVVGVDVALPDNEALVAMIVDSASNKLVERIVPRVYNEDGHSYLYREDTELTRQVREASLERIAERAKLLADELVRDLFAKGVVKTDAYGQPRADTRVTVAELVQEHIDKELVYRPQSRNSFRGERSVLENAISEEVRTKLSHELNQALAEAKGQIVGTVRQNATEILTEIVAKSMPR